MSHSAPDPAVRHVPEEHRFVVEVDGASAELVYDNPPNRLVLVHTGVPDALGGRGIGGLLVRAAVERAAADHLTVVPWCPFARRWLREHPDIASTVTIDWDTPPPDHDSEDADD
jgi:predicted GNAT family acetyltransferase